MSNRKTNVITQLNTPTRQSPVAILLILLKLVQIIVKQTWPFLIVIFFKQNNSGSDSWFAWVSIGIAGVSALLSIISYFKFYYYVDGDELVIKKGIFQKTKLNIPIDRIQTINFKQNIIHRVFNVVSIEIDTAGSKGNEFSLDALSQAEAQAIRSFLISKKAKLQTNETFTKENIPKEKEELLLRLKPVDLLKIGVGQNHFRTILVILATAFGFYQYLEASVGEQIVNGIQSFFGFTFESIFWNLLMIAPFLFLVAFIVTLFNTVLKYFDLRFIKTTRGFKIVSGLFTRKERSANLQKIQFINWSRNPIKRIFGLYDIRLSQATSSKLTEKQSLYVPGAYIHQLKEVRAAYMPQESQIPFAIHRISKAVIGRRVLYIGLLPASVICLLEYFDGTLFSADLFFPLIWVLFVFITSKIYFKKWKYELSDEGLRIQRGVIGQKASLLKWYKVQTVKIQQGIYQQRKDLADIYFSTAGGTIRIPYIELEKARNIKNFVLYKIETNHRKWM